MRSIRPSTTRDPTDAADEDVAGARALERDQQARQRALPRAGASDENARLAALDREVDTIEHDLAVVALGHSLHLDEGWDGATHGVHEAIGEHEPCRAATTRGTAQELRAREVAARRTRWPGACSTSDS
jgi:hypothetical protein